jgi:uncharacterized membrane protein YphA (DoxX/SURF4 family)
MTGFTKTFLVLLRLAIGWHFLFEGLEKVATYYPKRPSHGTTVYGWPPWRPVHAEAEKSKPAQKAWTSESYLRAANGPLAGVFHDLAGDSILDRVEVLEPTAAEPDDKKYLRMPVGLAKDWQAYFDRLVEHYQVKDKQLEMLEIAFKQRKDQTVRWLLSGTLPIARPAPNGNATIETDVKVADHVAQYKAKLNEAAKASNATDREEAWAEAEKIRGELQKAVDGQTAEMKSVLEGKTFISSFFTPKHRAAGAITDQQKAEYGSLPVPVVPPLSDWNRLDWIDFATRWGLVIIGGCLLAGLFTRTAAVGGALFLLMLYLAMPPLPWLPPNPRAEGHYLYVNKNLIEMLALLVLATTRSGRWVGLDALWPLVWRRSRAARPGPSNGQPPERKKEFHPIALEAPAYQPVAGDLTGPRITSTPKEPTHGH